jgi:hypothetical protein
LFDYEKNETRTKQTEFKKAILFFNNTKAEWSKRFPLIIVTKKSIFENWNFPEILEQTERKNNSNSRPNMDVEENSAHNFMNKFILPMTEV